MEFSKENIFKIEYTSVFGQETNKKNKWTSKLLKFIKQNKLISITLTVFFLCLLFNFVLIFNFMQILENI
jgi:uncharacterized membrane protein (DUF485 family)